MPALLRVAGRLLALLGLVAAPVSGQPTAATPKSDARALAAKAADPTAHLAQLTFDETFVGGTRGAEGYANSLLFQPVIPLGPLGPIPFGQILRPSVPLLTTPGPDRTTGLGDITLFDVFTPLRRAWGTWGIGPVFVFPTGRDERLSAQKWQIGPAAAFLYDAIPNLQLRVIVQNPISFAGRGDRPDVNQLLLQPIAQYNLANGWYVSMGERRPSRWRSSWAGS